MANEISVQLGNELKLVRSTAFWKRYQAELSEALEWYDRLLRGDGRIGDTLTYGAHWQEMRTRIKKIMDTPDSIVERAGRGEER